MLYNKNWQKPRIDAKPLSQIYGEAADAIREHGHARFKLKDDNGSMCIWGAISLVVDGDALVASNESYKMLAPLSEIIGGDVVSWNNREGRTKRQVLGLLRKAARRAP